MNGLGTSYCSASTRMHASSSTPTSTPNNCYTSNYGVTRKVVHASVIQRCTLLKKKLKTHSEMRSPQLTRASVSSDHPNENLKRQNGECVHAHRKLKMPIKYRRTKQGKPAEIRYKNRRGRNVSKKGIPPKRVEGDEHIRSVTNSLFTR